MTVFGLKINLPELFGTVGLSPQDKEKGKSKVGVMVDDPGIRQPSSGSGSAANVVAETLRGGLYTRVVGRRLLFFQEVGSTMDEAARLAAEGADEGTVVIAEVQTAGRGRQGRSWVSRPGNLLLSVLFRPDVSQLPFISIIGGLATARTLRNTAGLDPRIKWPNDLMLEGSKVAGILAESAIEGESVCYAVLGIGLNVAFSPGDEDLSSIATSVSRAAGEEVARESLLRQLLMELDGLYRSLPGPGQENGNGPVAEWTRLLDTIGRRVTATFRDERFEGEAVGVDSTGNLLLRLESGEVKTLTAGDVTLGGSTA